MNGKILKKYKIDERYVLSERKFLYTFGYLCLEHDLVDGKGLTKKQLYYFLEQKLTPASEEDVNFANVATGKIILVGRTGNFRAYHRPIEMEHIHQQAENVKLKKNYESYRSSITDSLGKMKLSEVLTKYYENDDNDASILYLEELLSRVKTASVNAKEEPARKYKNKIKCYKRNLESNIDK